MTAPADPRSRPPAALRLAPRAVRAACWAVLLVIVAVSAARYAVKIQKPGNDGLLSRSAFLRWRPQLNELARGVDSYAKYNYPNPPVMALILLPLAELPPMAGAMTWFGLKVAMAGLVLVWAVRLAAPADRPMPDWAKVVVVVLSLHPLLGDLSHGNVNIFIAFLVLAGLELFRRRCDVSAGLVLALAAACKVTPALFLPYLIWKRAWRAAAGMAVGVGLWLFVVPGAAFGFERNVTLLTSWYDGMVRPFVIEGKVTPEHANQSIPGVVARLLTHSPSDFRYDEDDGHPVPEEDSFYNVADIGPGGAKWVVRGFQAVFAVAGVLLLWTPVTGPAGVRQGPRFAAEIGLIVLGMLLFSERTWKHHAVTMVVPIAVLAAVFTDPRSGRRLKGFAFACQTLAVAFAVIPSTLNSVRQDLALVYGSHTVVFLILSAGMCGVLAARDPDRSGPDRPPVPAG